MEKKDLTGVLFKNNKQNEKQPDYQGTFIIDGKELRLGAWLRKSSKGTTYMSLMASNPQKPESKPIDNDFIDDEVPFN